MSVEHFIWDSKTWPVGRWRVVKRADGETWVQVEMVPGAPENDGPGKGTCPAGRRWGAKPEDLVPINDEFTETERVIAGASPAVAAFYGERVAA